MHSVNEKRLQIMKKNLFDLKSVIARYSLDETELAKVLFPYVRYQKQALDRILKGEADLDVVQIEKLAAYAGVLVSDLFFVDSWKGSTEDGCLIFKKGEYKVKLNYKGVYMSVYKDHILIAQEVANVPGMLVADFLEYVDSIINKYEKQHGNN